MNSNELLLTKLQIAFLRPNIVINFASFFYNSLQLSSQSKNEFEADLNEFTSKKLE